MFKMYDEPESPHEGAVFKIYDETGITKRGGACLRYMIRNRNPSIA